MDKTKLNKWYKIVDYIIAIAVVVTLVWAVYYHTRPEYVVCETEDWDEGWYAEAHGEIRENIKLSSELFEMCNRGDVVTLTRIAHTDTKIPNPVLNCYSVHSVVEVYLDGEQIYGYGRDLYENNELLGYGNSYIQLPEDYEGKELKVVFTVTEDNAFEGIPKMTVCNGSTITQKCLAKGRISLLITMFEIMFGLLGMLLSLVMLVRNKAFRKTFCITTFSFIIGCWTLCNSDMITLFIPSLKLKVYMEYISFFTMMLPFIGYFYDAASAKDSPKFLKRYYAFVFVADIILTIVIMALQFTNLVHFPAFVTAEHIIMVMSMILALMIAIVEVRRMEKKITVLGVGFTLAIAVSFIELLRFNFSKYLIGFADNKYNSTMQFATLIIVITLLVDFCQMVTNNLYEQAQTELLHKLAYMDELTELANRRKCDEAMDSMDKDYAIVSLDMNSLKFINDTYGHDVGDRALQAFARIIGKTFPNDATVGRMGGDEFVAIMPNTTERDVENCVTEMNRMIAEFNASGTEKFVLSAAWGIAMGLATDNAHAVYSRADAKMYECKRSMKAQQA